MPIMDTGIVDPSMLTSTEGNWESVVEPEAMSRMLSDKHSAPLYVPYADISTLPYLPLYSHVSRAANWTWQ